MLHNHDMKMPKIPGVKFFFGMAVIWIMIIACSVFGVLWLAWTVIERLLPV